MSNNLLKNLFMIKKYNNKTMNKMISNNNQILLKMLFKNKYK